MGVKTRLESLMRERGLNASQLAEMAGLSKSTVYALLRRDSSNIGYQTAQKLAEALNVDVGHIVKAGGEVTEMRQPYSISIGARIRQARKLAGLTQKELGARLGIKQQSIAMFENDKTNIKYSTVKKNS